MGQRLSLLIEPWLAFYDPDFAPPALLRSQPLRNRAGVEFEMKVRKLSNVGRDRNNRMWSRLETDPAYCDLARRIWTQGWQPLAQDRSEEHTSELQSIMRSSYAFFCLKKKINYFIP